MTQLNQNLTKKDETYEFCQPLMKNNSKIINHKVAYWIKIIYFSDNHL
jgi:hypothetical protein